MMGRWTEGCLRWLLKEAVIEQRVMNFTEARARERLGLKPASSNFNPDYHQIIQVDYWSSLTGSTGSSQPEVLDCGGICSTHLANLGKSRLWETSLTQLIWSTSVISQMMGTARDPLHVWRTPVEKQGGGSIRLAGWRESSRRVEAAEGSAVS